MRCRPAKDPGWWIFLVLIDRLVEVDLVQVAADRQPMQGNVLLATLALQILAEVHRPYLQNPSAIPTRATSINYRYRGQDVRNASGRRSGGARPAGRSRNRRHPGPLPVATRA